MKVQKKNLIKIKLIAGLFGGGGWYRFEDARKYTLKIKTLPVWWCEEGGRGRDLRVPKKLLQQKNVLKNKIL